MIPRSERHSYFKSLVFSKLFLLFLFVAIGFISFTIIKGFINRTKVDQDVVRLKQEITKLESSNKDLESLLGYLDSPDFAKQEAKEKFGLKEQGEQVVVLNDVEAGARRLPPSESQTVELSNPQKWLRYFFSNN